MRTANVLYCATAAFLVGACSDSPSAIAVRDHAESSAVAAPAKIVRDFVDGPFGQVHLRRIDPQDSSLRPPVVLFHPTARSSDFFRLFMPELGSDRTIIALDTPGYGESAPPSEPQTVESLTNAMSVALDNLELGRGTAIDVVGVHTGSLIAAELALQRPDLVRRVVLSGIPLFEGEDRERRREQLVGRYASMDPEDASHLQRFWESQVVNREAGMSFERAAEAAYDQFRSGQRYYWAFISVMGYDTAARLPLIEQPVLVLNIHDNMAPYNVRAMDFLRDGTFVDLPESGRSAFDLKAAGIASHIRLFFDGSEPRAGIVAPEFAQKGSAK